MRGEGVNFFLYPAVDIFICDHYRAWKRKLSVVMRQVHRAGEKAFVDYCDGLSILDRDSNLEWVGVGKRQ